jgi:hypothetical protein
MTVPPRLIYRPVLPAFTISAYFPAGRRVFAEPVMKLLFWLNVIVSKDLE